MSTRTEDLVEIHQLLAKYAVTITQGDIDGLVEVFTPDGTYSAFGDTYTLDRFPVLVDAAPKGLFMTGTALVDLDGDTGTGTGTQPLCFIEHSQHDMRIGYYRDTYQRTPGGWVGYPMNFQPATINWKHIDGPLMYLTNGQLHWLTYRERIQLFFRLTDIHELDVKHQRRPL